MGGVFPYSCYKTKTARPNEGMLPDPIYVLLIVIKYNSNIMHVPRKFVSIVHPLVHLQVLHTNILKQFYNMHYCHIILICYPMYQQTYKFHTICFNQY